MLPWNGLTHIMLSKGHLITEFKFLQQVIYFINFFSSCIILLKIRYTSIGLWVFCKTFVLTILKNFQKNIPFLDSFSGLGLRLLAKNLAKKYSIFNNFSENCQMLNIRLQSRKKLMGQNQEIN